jgi:hypothetical protein
LNQLGEIEVWKGTAKRILLNVTVPTVRGVEDASVQISHQWKVEIRDRAREEVHVNLTEGRHEKNET